MCVIPIGVSLSRELLVWMRRNALIEIEFTQRASLVGSLLRLAQRFLESLVEQLLLILFRFYRLAEYVFFAFILRAHGLGGSFKVFEGPLAWGRGVRQDRPGLGVDFQDRPAIGTGHVERLVRFALHCCQHSKTFNRDLLLQGCAATARWLCDRGTAVRLVPPATPAGPRRSAIGTTPQLKRALEDGGRGKG